MSDISRQEYDKQQRELLKREQEINREISKLKQIEKETGITTVLRDSTVPTKKYITIVNQLN